MSLPKAHNLKKYKEIFRWLIALVCILYLVIFFYKNQDSLQIAFKLDYKIIFYVIILQFIAHLLTNIRFQLIIQKCTSVKLKFFYWMKLYFLGRFLNLVFPQSGNLYRSVKLKKDFGISYTNYISSFTSFAWMDTFIDFFIAFIVIIITNPAYKLGPFYASAVLIVLGLTILTIPILTELIFRKLKFKNKKINWLHSKLHEVLVVLIRNLKDPVFMAKITFLGLAIFIRTSLAFYIYFSIFDINITLPAIVLFTSLYKLTTFIVITPANIGIQEVAYGFLSEQTQIGMASGVIVSATVRVISNIFIIIIGLTLGGFDLVKKRKEFAENTRNEKSKE